MPRTPKRSAPAASSQRSRSNRPGARRSGARRRSQRAKRRARRARWLLLSLIGGLALVAGVALWGARPSEGPIDFERGFIELTLRAEQLEVGRVGQQLHEAGLLEDPNALRWAKWRSAPNARFEAGPHWLPRAASDSQLVGLLSRRTRRPTTRVTIPEGWDSFQIARRLAERGICSERAFLAVVHDPQLASAWLGKTSLSLEGYLYPATYDLRLNTEATTIARRLVDEAKRRFEPLIEAGPDPLRRFTPAALESDEVVILASLVEKEAASSAEHGPIASVFINRLTDDQFRPRRMLQSDPTAGYGCKRRPELTSCREYQGRISPQMLRDPDNPYNTYKQPGLPPTPVGNPSAATVGAVLQAPRTDYLFFYAARDGQAHVFSRTLAEHRAAISSSRRAP